MHEDILSAYASWEALVTYQQMLSLADLDGVVDMQPWSISRRTGIPIEIIKLGIDYLSREDPENRNQSENGKRLIPLYEHLDWGWKIVDYERYRGTRREKDRREYHRQYAEKRRQKAKAEDQEGES